MFCAKLYFRFMEILRRMFVQTAQMWDLKEADDLLEELQADPVQSTDNVKVCHDDVIKWKYFPCYWPFVRGIHRSPVNSPHKGQWRGALMFSLICALNKRMGKQSWDWWFETPSRSSWRHCNVTETMVTSSCHEYNFRFTTPLSRHSTGQRWIPFTKGQLCGALVFRLMLAWTSWWTNSSCADDLWRHNAHMTSL